MVEPFASRCGLPSLRVDGVALHSPYDPPAEARRFAREALGAEPASTVVLLGEGLGYLGQAIAEAAPGARLVAVCYSADVDRYAVSRAPASWSPASPSTLTDFLRGAIGELDVEGLKVIEWPASARLFPEAARRASLAVRTVVRELNGSCATAAAMGRLWIRSALWNLVGIDDVRRGPPGAHGRPIVIAASGPTLARSLGAISGVRAGIELWALPSAVQALSAAGLAPDLVVLTDPGHWAMVHLHFAGACCPVAMPLSAARGAWRCGVPVRLLSQGTMIERDLLAAAGIDAPLAAPHGTVAATALDLALAATRGPVIFAGLDLSALDSETHVRPNAFDTLLRLADGRLSPHHGLAYARARAGEAETRLVDGVRVRVSRSLDTYAGWLADRAAAARGRVFRLVPSPVGLPGAAPLDAAGLADLVRASTGTPPAPLSPDPRWPDAAARRAAARVVLSRWAGTLARGAEQARAGSWTGVLAGSADLADLAWHASARGLLDAVRRQRLGDSDGAQEAAVRLFEDASTFIRSLDSRLAAGEVPS